MNLRQESCGDPKGTRTPEAAVRGRSLNRLTMGPYQVRIFENSINIHPQKGFPCRSDVAAQPLGHASEQGIFYRRISQLSSNFLFFGFTCQFDLSIRAKLTTSLPALMCQFHYQHVRQNGPLYYSPFGLYVSISLFTFHF